MTATKGAKKKGYNRFFRILGPGLITGAADDDPSGIATYSQAGAAYGFGQIWTMLLCLPLMIGVQEASARIAAATGKGLVKVTAEIYSKGIVRTVVALVIIANVINIGADIAAIGGALNLLIPLPVFFLSTMAAIVILSLEVFVGYHSYTRFLKILALTLLAYVATAFIVGPNWGEVAKAFVVPQITWSTSYWYVIVALIGTTISPYMFFWQAAEEVEERKQAKASHHKRRTLTTIRHDNAIGMFVSQIGAVFILITTAVTLHQNGKTNINSAEEAAKALEPLVQGFPNAGLAAKTIFAIGIIGMGLLGIPVLAGSVAYAVTDTTKWKQGLDYKFGQAKAFYAVIIAATLAGWAMNAIGIDPIKSLVFAAVINGMVSIPLIFLLSRISVNKKVMGNYTGGRLSRITLMAAFIVVTAAGAIMLFSLI